MRGRTIGMLGAQPLGAVEDLESRCRRNTSSLHDLLQLRISNEG